ncbi:60s ribosomal protein [Nannochloropsis oceanica]
MVQLFTRFVEVGRVVLVNYGPDYGKLATVIDVVDGNKVLVEGPDSNVTRQVIPLKRVYLTDLKVKIPRNARAKTLKKAWATDKIVARWEQTTWCKKLEAKAKRAALTDFDRFKLMVARKEKAAIIKKHLK